MPIENNQSFDPNFSEALAIESLISAPLLATSKANENIVQEQIKFLLDTCFDKVGENYAPKMIQIALTRNEVVPEKPAVARIAPSASDVLPIAKGVDEELAIPSSIRSFTENLNFPLLSIIPLNSLSVENVSIDFDMEITAITIKPKDTAHQFGNKISDKKVQLYGKIIHDPNTNGKPSEAHRSKFSNKINVKVNAENVPLPFGVSTIIALYSKAILPISKNN